MDTESINSDSSETVYGTQDDNHVMSEKVQSLAATVYQEFERMIKKYDEDVVKELMPLVVGILETMDISCASKQEGEVELELLRDDNEQLLTQYEREKQLRRAAEQKYLEVEDTIEAEKKDLDSKVDSLESIVRMLELKARNSSDHVTRLEEKEVEMKKEYSKLHERYTDLFKTHMDYMEKAKMLLGSDRISDLAHSPRGFGPSRSGMNLPLLKPDTISLILGAGETPTFHDATTPLGSDCPTPDIHPGSNLSLKSELESRAESTTHKTDRGQVTDTINRRETSTGTTSTPDNEKDKHLSMARNNDSLFDEFNTDVIEDGDFNSDITGKEVHPGDYASSDEDDDNTNKETNINENVNDNFFGMGREVENLIMENTELLATKNALNIVKDDLIAKVDDLMSQQEILREDISSLQTVKSRLNLRITQLEDDLKKARDEIDKKAQGAQGEDEDDVPMAQRKRFTRVEMARVLMERNQYKERLMELQEAVRWTEMIRASREHPELAPKKKTSMWGFFSSLIVSPEEEEPVPERKKPVGAAHIV